MQKRIKKWFYVLMKYTFFSFISFSIYADCLDPPILSQINLHFFEYDLGQYTINLTHTLNAIKNDNAGSSKPYYKKTWYGDCPGGLSGSAGSCVEYTVYPNADNFSPGDIMQKIEQHTDDGSPNRGEVRILTNADQTEYVYTVDHERTFCGPYSLSALS
jgi:hypothetical protein